MSESDPLALADTWDLVAEGFDRSVWELFGQFGRRALELVDPPSDARLLDLACGAGSLTIPAAGRVAAVTAVDFSPRMVAATRRRIAAAGLANVEVHRADGQALPLPDNSFDTAFSLFGLMFFPSRQRGLRELGRVLRSGALAVISSWPPMASSPAMVAMVESLAEATGAPLPDFAAPGPLGAESAIRSEVDAAGLDVVAIERFDGRLRAQTFDVVWGMAHDANAYLQLAKQQLGDRFPTVVDQLASGLRQRLGEPPYDLPLPAIMTLMRVR